MFSLLAALSGVSGSSADPTGPKPIHSEADLVLPDFHKIDFVGMSGWALLALGLLVCGVGLLFGMRIYKRLKDMPVHKSMLDVSELIYATCKTYLFTQGRFIALL